jgi:hypothetical protein
MKAEILGTWGYVGAFKPWQIKSLETESISLNPARDCRVFEI